VLKFWNQLIVFNMIIQYRPSSDLILMHRDGFSSQTPCTNSSIIGQSPIHEALMIDIKGNRRYRNYPLPNAVLGLPLVSISNVVFPCNQFHQLACGRHSKRIASSWFDLVMTGIMMHNHYREDIEFRSLPPRSIAGVWTSARYVCCSAVLAVNCSAKI
jgi:hypothetical protein